MSRKAIQTSLRAKLRVIIRRGDKHGRVAKSTLAAAPQPSRCSHPLALYHRRTTEFSSRRQRPPTNRGPWPALVFMDGDDLFEFATAAYGEVRASNAVPPLVLVGALRRQAHVIRQLDHLHLRKISEQTSPRDRKSTRLNSSHPSISYAVFCLKKK